MLIFGLLVLYNNHKVHIPKGAKRMADIFGAIAAAKKTASRLPLISPKPQEKNRNVLSMTPSVSPPAPVYKKMDSKNELDLEIEKLKSKYAPFRRKVAPDFKSKRKRFVR